MKAFVYAGNACTKEAIQGKPTPFVRLEGQPLLLYVLAAVDRVRDIDEIIVIGPQSGIMTVIEKALPHILLSKTISVREEDANLAETMQSVYMHPIKKAKDGENPLQLIPSEPTALFLPGNVPLLTSNEIEAFLSTSDLKKHDIAVGMTPRFTQETRFQVNNLYLFRPFRLKTVIASSELSDPSELLPTEDVHSPKNIAEKNGLPYYLQQGLKNVYPHTKERNIIAPFQGKIDIEMLKVLSYKTLKLKVIFNFLEKGYGSLHIEDTESYDAARRHLDEWRRDRTRSNGDGGTACPISGDFCPSD